ncbi:MAG: hypothetical protein ACOYCD_03145 [Kiritimatiellia bacterium]|jgi:hypothetical protein
MKFGKPVVLISTVPYSELLIPDEIRTVVVSYGLMRDSVEMIAKMLFNG